MYLAIYFYQGIPIVNILRKKMKTMKMRKLRSLPDHVLHRECLDVFLFIMKIYIICFLYSLTEIFPDLL